MAHPTKPELTADEQAFLAKVPVIREAGHREGSGYLFSFGAYGATSVAVIGGSVEDGLEGCLEWVDENAPGLLHTIGPEDYAEAAAELGVPWPPEDGDYDTEAARDVQESAEADMYMVGHTTLKNGNAIPSWEWTVRDLTSTELARLMRRFCADCRGELSGVESVLCADCEADLIERVVADLRIERAGLSAPEEGASEDELPSETDVRLQVSRWGHDWRILTGSADYDQDHRGHWGAASIAHDSTDEQLASIAEDLVDQALEHAATEES